jgi:hypothetical protein
MKVLSMVWTMYPTRPPPGRAPAQGLLVFGGLDDGKDVLDVPEVAHVEVVGQDHSHKEGEGEHDDGDDPQAERDGVDDFVGNEGK